jgi:hypothetical protein
VGIAAVRRFIYYLVGVLLALLIGFLIRGLITFAMTKAPVNRLSPDVSDSLAFALGALSVLLVIVWWVRRAQRK